MPFKVRINTRESSQFQNPIQSVDFFTSIKLDLKYDALASTFQLDYLFDPKKESDLEIAGVTHYHEMLIDYIYPGGTTKRILTGFVLSQNFVAAPTPELTSIGGYSKSGVLDDCDIATGDSNEIDGMTLLTIIKNACSFFNINVISSTPILENSLIKLEKATTKVSENVGSFLKRICAQKNVILTHDAYANIVVKKANTETPPVLKFDLDSSPNTGYERKNLNFKGQGLYSPIVCVRQADDEGGNYSMSGIDNPFIPTAVSYKEIFLQKKENKNKPVRFKSEVQDSGDDVTVGSAVNFLLQKNLKNISLVIDIITDIDKTSIIMPEDIIFIKSKELNMFEPTKWFIERNEIEQTPSSIRQKLTCVLPWVYDLKATGANGKSGPYNVFIKPGKNRPGE